MHSDSPRRVVSLVLAPSYLLLATCKVGAATRTGSRSGSFSFHEHHSYSLCAPCTKLPAVSALDIYSRVWRWTPCCCGGMVSSNTKSVPTCRNVTFQAVSHAWARAHTIHTLICIRHNSNLRLGQWHLICLAPLFDFALHKLGLKFII